jgi:hypothetical protein
MKKFLVLVAVLVAVGIFPLAAYAHDRDYDHERHDRHEQMWRDHEPEWRGHEREWREHSRDSRWREEHRRMWHDWYDWHRANENEFHLRVSDEGFELDIRG